MDNVEVKIQIAEQEYARLLEVEAAAKRIYPCSGFPCYTPNSWWIRLAKALGINENISS